MDQLHPSHVPSVIGTATPKYVFTVTTDAAKWVQIYGLLRPTDANDVRYITNMWRKQHKLVAFHCDSTDVLPLLKF